MELVLRKHDSRKDGWHHVPIRELYGHASDELDEAKQALDSDDHAHASYEAIDLANTAMMIWDAIVQCPEAQDK